MKKLAIGIPCYRSLVRVEHVMMALRVAQACGTSCGAYGFAGVLYADTCSIDYSRNMLLHMARQHGADWLLMADADTFHVDGGDVLRMVDLAVQTSTPVVAAPVRRRGTDNHNVVIGDAQVAIADLRNRTRTVDRVGAAFMAIDIDWLSRVWPVQPWFLTQQLSGDVPSKVSEDYAFCDGVRARGGDIVVDGRFEPTHAE